MAAFIIRTGELSASEVRQYVRENLARYKVPRDVHFVENLPRTTTGKISRPGLAEIAASRSDND